MSSVSTRRFCARGALLVLVVVVAITSCSLLLNPVPQNLEPDASWSWVDGATDAGLNYSPAQSAHYPQITSDGEQLHITWYESNGVASQIRVATMTTDGAEWMFADGGGATGINGETTMDAEWSRIVVHDGDLITSWHEWDPTDGVYRIRVAQLDANGTPPRNLIDFGGLHAGSGFEAIHASLASYGGALYASWRERQVGDGKYQIRVARLASTWESVDRDADGGINIDVGQSAYYPKLTVHDDALYAIWHERFGEGRTAQVSRFDESSGTPSWVSIDPGPIGLNFNPDAFADGPQTLSAGELLVGLWTERVAGLRTTLRVVVYDGGWSFIDGATADGLAWDQSESVRWARASVGGTGIADDLSKWLFVAWAEGTDTTDVVHVAARQIINASGEPSLVELGGSGPDWIFLSPDTGLVFAAKGDVEYPHTSFHDGDLYVAFSEMIDRTFRVRVARANLDWIRP